MRAMIFNWVRAKIPDGEILPWWAVAIRAVLFPLDFFARARGYQVSTDTWLIDGVRYSSSMFQLLANAHGETYRVTRSGDTVIFELVSSGE